MNTFELDKEYVASTYARFDLNLVKGKGSKAYDEKGKEYIDLGTGIGVTAFGFCDEEWVKAVNAQLNSLQHTSNLYYTNPCALLAKALCEKTGMKKVFFSNSGAESNEAAIKAIRLYAEENKGKDYYTILTLENSFHGRTLATLAATGQDHFHEHFGPLPEGFVTIEPTREALFEACEKYKVAGIMFEAIRGEGGVIPMDKEFAKALTDAAKIYDIVLCADEVQCGNGRTGQYFGYMKLGLEPDVVSTAKGLGGGLPIGATLLGKKVENVFKPGLNGTTFGGNPVVCAGALSIINRINSQLLDEVNEKSDYIVKSLTGVLGIESVTGMGLMLGVKPVNKTAKEVANACMAKGVLVLTAKDKVRLLPALNIPMEDLKKGIEVLKEVCNN